MAHLVWRFEYSVEERIEALRDILMQQEKVLPSHVKREWFYHAQLVLEPGGWTALWKLPRETCRKLGVRFPCVVYVTVEDLQLSEDELAAHVEILAVQDDSVHLPERCLVPLEELWPTLAQSNTAIEMKSTARFIDLYRFFYNYIWMPWDLEEDESDGGRCWFKENVPARCNLWSAAFSCKGLKTDELYTLRDDGETVRRNILKIEDGISSDGEDNLGDAEDENISTLVSLHKRLQALRARWELLQNPTLQCLWNAENSKSTPKSEVILVWQDGSIQMYKQFFKESCNRLTELKVEDKNVGCASSLIAALNSEPDTFSVILLCQGTHPLPYLYSVNTDCSIHAASINANQTVLKCSEETSTAISIYKNMTLKDLTFDTALSATGFAVKLGCLVMHSCVVRIPRKFKGSADILSQAVIVFENAEIVFANCTISGYYTGIIANSGSNVKLVDCIFENCGVALQIYEGSRITMKRCKFINCSETAIRYESLHRIQSMTGSIDLLKGVSPILNFDECTFSGNGKNEVCLASVDEFVCSKLDEGCAM